MNDLMRFLLYLPPQASTIADDIDGLHYFVIISTMLGATGVALAVIYFVIRYRRRTELQITPRVIIPLKYEVGIIGFLLALFLTFWVIGYYQYIDFRRIPERSHTVYVEGKQWMWKFADEQGGTGAGDLVVPAGIPVQLVMTSRDVIHSFYVPAFRIKMDVLPGRTTTTWFTATEPGSYAILCAEFCGNDHSRMRAEIHVLPPQDYAVWLETRARMSQSVGLVTDPALEVVTPTEGTRPLAEVGESVAVKYGCLSCHSVDGGDRAGPSWLGLYGAERQLVSGQTVIADDAYLTKSMMQPLTDIVQGYAPVMPTYQGLLQPAEIAALLEFIRSLELPPASELPPEIPRVSVPLNLGGGQQQAQQEQAQSQQPPQPPQPEQPPAEPQPAPTGASTTSPDAAAPQEAR